MNLLRASIAPVAAGQHFFRAVTVTGGHAASLAAVAGGAADIAAIDCVTYALLARLRPETVAAVRVLTETPASPALPLIASSELPEASVPVLRAGLMALERDPDAAEARRALLIDGFEVLDEAAYDAVKALEMGAISLGYPTLA
jgi:ABC-type phosphate/phosphonate transport system substrate-binding protein